MLVLSRRESERILFPQLGITVEVVKVAGHMARIGIEAPRNVRVLREEVADQERVEFPAATGDACVQLELRNCLSRFSRQLEDMLDRCDPETGDAVESMLDEIEYRIQELGSGQFVAEPQSGYRVSAPGKLSTVNKKSTLQQPADPVRYRIALTPGVPSLPC